MANHQLISLMIVIIMICTKDTLTVISGDYCAHEYFQPTCSVNEVIVMERAIYGRMKLGRCLEMDPSDQNFNNTKYIGCSADVLDILDQRCSGLKTCNVQIIDPALIKRSACYRGLMLYLSVKYSCYSVAPPDRACSLSVGSEPLHVAFNGINDNTCLTSGSTLILEASHGQTINASLIMFHLATSDHDIESSPKRGKPNSQESSCYEGSPTSVIIGHFKNLDGMFQDVQRITTCYGEPRQKNVFVSKANKIEFQRNQLANSRFLLILTYHFIVIIAIKNFYKKEFLNVKRTSKSATGCYDLKPPQDAWMKREGSEITVGCYMNRHTWKLFCNGRNWVGVIGNCTQLNEQLELDTSNEMASNNENQHPKTQNVFLLLVLICLTFVIFTVVTCAVLLFCQRRNRYEKSKNPYLENGNQSFNITNVNPLLDQLAKETNIINNGGLTLQKKDFEGATDPCYYVLEGQAECDK